MFGAYMRIKHLFDIPNTSFKPIPKVTSSFVSIKPKLDNEIIVKNNQHLALIVKKGFSQRRKTIKNALKGLIGENILIEHEINPSQRPEEISILKWSQLSNVVTKNEK
jgi:16S rRNA (adenine1518-N6/adenine1519-N6)-dimethyltransferase